MYGEENHFRSDPRRRDNAPSAQDFVPLTVNARRKTKKCGRKRNFFEAMQESVRAKFASFEPEKHNLTVRPEVLRKDDRVHQGT